MGQQVTSALASKANYSLCQFKLLTCSSAATEWKEGPHVLASIDSNEKIHVSTLSFSHNLHLVAQLLYLQSLHCDIASNAHMKASVFC